MKQRVWSACGGAMATLVAMIILVVAAGLARSSEPTTGTDSLDAWSAPRVVEAEFHRRNASLVGLDSDHLLATGGVELFNPRAHLDSAALYQRGDAGWTHADSVSAPRRELSAAATWGDARGGFVMGGRLDGDWTAEVWLWTLGADGKPARREQTALPRSPEYPRAVVGDAWLHVGGVVEEQAFVWSAELDALDSGRELNWNESPPIAANGRRLELIDEPQGAVWIALLDETAAVSIEARLLDASDAAWGEPIRHDNVGMPQGARALGGSFGSLVLASARTTQVGLTQSEYLLKPGRGLEPASGFPLWGGYPQTLITAHNPHLALSLSVDGALTAHERRAPVSNQTTSAVERPNVWPVALNIVGGAALALGLALFFVLRHERVKRFG